MNPNALPNNSIDLKKLIEAIDLRFVSGNTVPVERAHVRAHEWDELKRVISSLKNK